LAERNPLRYSTYMYQPPPVETVDRYMLAWKRKSVLCSCTWDICSNSALHGSIPVLFYL